MHFFKGTTRHIEQHISAKFGTGHFKLQDCRGNELSILLLYTAFIIEKNYM